MSMLIDLFHSYIVKFFSLFSFNFCKVFVTSGFQCLANIYFRKKSNKQKLTWN